MALEAKNKLLGSVDDGCVAAAGTQLQGNPGDELTAVLGQPVPQVLQPCRGQRQRLGR